MIVCVLTNSSVIGCGEIEHHILVNSSHSHYHIEHDDIITLTARVAVFRELYHNN